MRVVTRQRQSREHERETAASVTYDLRSKDSTAGDGKHRGSRAGRIPRDVKERMKILPRFIAVLREGRTAAPTAAGGL
ncbi:unnamed protein product [Sphacelaria rigidula]